MVYPAVRYLRTGSAFCFRKIIFVENIMWINVDTAPCLCLAGDALLRDCTKHVIACCLRNPGLKVDTRM